MTGSKLSKSVQRLLHLLIVIFFQFYEWFLVIRPQGLSYRTWTGDDYRVIGWREKDMPGLKRLG